MQQDVKCGMGSTNYFGIIKYVLNCKNIYNIFMRDERLNTQTSIKEQVSSQEAFKEKVKFHEPVSTQTSTQEKGFAF